MDVRDFLKSSDPVTLKLTKKDDVQDTAKELRIEVKKGVSKVEIQRKIVEYYIDKGTFDEGALELFVEGEPTEDELQLLLEIVNREHELKLKQLEREAREAAKQREEAERQRQLEREKWQREDHVAERQRQFKREKLQQKGLVSDPDDLHSSEGLVLCDEFESCIPGEVRAYPVAEDAPTLKGFDKKADKEVLTHKVGFTPERSLPESSWEVRDDLEFETGTSDDSPEEAVVLIDCVQVVEVPVSSQDSEHNVEAQLKSEVPDLVERECSPCVSDDLGSVSKGLTLVPVESEDSQSFVVDRVLEADEVNVAGSNGKSAVPGILDKVLEKVGLVVRPLTLLAG
ncbi:uncharacterized protein LOC134346150 [Mobula hypostoma]|uniref:uncharacterized protein LOC134346150 n=1 Tax=Mobula hypostoma TaxID=723540 RepID=UPI002FC38538